ncbi:unnamed protein product, partial [Citrullus colocynthis]
MHSRSESDLHVLVCIHDQEDVPSAINLLEALNPTRHSHLAVYMLHLVELLGRANPQLIHHKSKKAPCSVAIVVERGIFNVSRCIVTNSYSFQIAVVFVGGTDDREAMFIGAGMAGHLKINLTLIRLLENENNLNHDVEERKHDNVAVVEFQRIMTSNERVMYIEEALERSPFSVRWGTIMILSWSEDDLLLSLGFAPARDGFLASPEIAGGRCSTLVQGLVLWNEHTELGAIGEVLASSNFMGNAMILVVQQHSKVISEDLENHQETDISLD